MPIEILWINHASFRIAGAGMVLYIDPWKVPDAPHDADVVFISHSHYDHCSPEDLAKVSRDDTVVFCPPDTLAQLSAGQAVTPGEMTTIGEMTLETVAAYNIGKTFHPADNQWCGAVITLGGKRIYYAGDTDLVPEMSELAEIDLALLPIGGTYTLTAEEAADACGAIGCKVAIPYHWGDIIGQADDANRFAATSPCPVTVLRPGQTYTLN